MNIYKSLTQANLRKNDPHFSLSRLHCFCRCPRQYYYRYIEERAEPLVYSPLSGAAVHKGLEEHNRRRFVEGRKSNVGVILEVAREYIRERYRKTEYDGAELREDQAVDATVREARPPLGTYCDRVEKDIKVVEAIEDEMKYELHGAPILGYADLVLDDLVLDYKFLKRRYTKDAVLWSPQLNLYVVYYKRPAAYVQLLRHQERAELSIAETTAETQRVTLAWVRDTIEAIRQAKKTGLFPRREAASWECQYCFFRSRCFKSKEV